MLIIGKVLPTPFSGTWAIPGKTSLQRLSHWHQCGRRARFVQEGRCFRGKFTVVRMRACSLQHLTKATAMEEMVGVDHGCLSLVERWEACCGTNCEFPREFPREFPWNYKETIWRKIGGALAGVGLASTCHYCRTTILQIPAVDNATNSTQIIHNPSAPRHSAPRPLGCSLFDLFVLRLH